MTETRPKPLTAEQAAELFPVRLQQACAEAAQQAHGSRGLRYIVWRDGMFMVVPRHGGLGWLERFDARRKG